MTLYNFINILFLSPPECIHVSCRDSCVSFYQPIIASLVPKATALMLNCDGCSFDLNLIFYDVHVIRLHGIARFFNFYTLQGAFINNTEIKIQHKLMQDCYSL